MLNSERYKLPCRHCGKILHNFHGAFARCSGGQTQFEPLDQAVTPVK